MLILEHFEANNDVILEGRSVSVANLDSSKEEEEEAERVFYT